MKVHAVGILAALALLIAGPSLGQEKPTVAPADYAKWEILSSRQVLSDDGSWLAYGISRVDGDSELRLRELGSEDERVFAWGADPSFSADGAWLAWTVRVSTQERERLREAREPVRTSVGLLELASGEERTFATVSSHTFDATGRFLALLGYAPEEPEGKGADLRVLDLQAGTEMSFGNVGEFAWSDVGTLLAFAVATGTDAGNGVQLYEAASGRLRALDSSGSSYRSLVWREDAFDLAGLRSAAAAREDGDSAYELLAWRGLDGDDAPRALLGAEALPEAMKLSANRTPRWGDDGERLSFGLRPIEPDEGAVEPDESASEDDGATDPPAEEEAPGGDSEPEPDADAEPELPDLQIWHSADRRLFPQQRAAASRDERRTLLAVWHLNDERVVQIGTDLMAVTRLLEGWDRALEHDSAPYAWGEMFGRPYHDVWVVDTNDGTRRRAAERVRRSWGSVAGGYLLTWDGEHYWSEELGSGARVNISADLDASFANTEYDIPTDQLPPHGVGGWLRDDEAVLLYDRFDVWRVAPDGSGGTRLTRGAEDEVVHRIARIDREEPALDPEVPLYFALRGEWSERRGYARLLPGASAPERLLWEAAYVRGLIKAKEADLYLYRSEAADDSPDTFVAGADLSEPRQVTATNPFQDDYAWTRAELFDFRSESDRRLQAGLLYPANHDPSRRYPMIVYTYEILTPQIHLYRTPSERDYYNYTAWTQAGYFVLLPDIVYRAREPGISAIEAVRPAVRSVVDRGLVDGDRVGLIGHSWGGYQATYLPTRTDIFAASVAGAPLTDFVSFMGQIHWNQGAAELSHWETGQARMEVPFWEDPEAHRRASPIHAVHEMETPLLMAFGNEDGVVDWDQGTEFYNFARRAGKQMVLLVYEGEDHGFRNEANQIDYHRRILEWFGHYLKGDPAPDWITKGVPVDRLEAEKARVAKSQR